MNKTVWIVSGEEVGGPKRYGPFVFQKRLSSYEMRRLAFWLAPNNENGRTTGGSYDSGVYVTEGERDILDNVDTLINNYSFDKRL